MMTLRPRRRGFTMIELLVVVLIIGVIASMAVPQYQKAVERSKADDAITTAQMIGTTNRMYALDNASYTIGPLDDATCYASNVCNDGGLPQDACELIHCNFLARQGWDAKPYACRSINVAADTCALGAGGTNYVSCCKRRATVGTPYSNWGYTMNVNGQVEAWGGAPAPPN